MNLHFVVPGFSKCGTTTLCSFLNEHPQIFIPDCKEPKFFTKHDDTDWPAYCKLFANARPEQMCGEGSTFYSCEEFADHSCKMMLSRFPDLRFIFIARCPISRLESSFREMHHSCHEYGIQPSYSIAETLRSLPNMINDTLYWARINEFRRYIPDQRIHTLFLENLKQQPEQELRKCFEFLGVDTSFTPQKRDRQLNAAGAKHYDTPYFRSILNGKVTGSLWRMLPGRVQRPLALLCGFRRTFTSPIKWDKDTLEWVLDQIQEDAQSYLEWAGAPSDFWDLKAPSRTKKAAA